MSLDHPLVESLLVPFLLVLAGVGLCRLGRCERWEGLMVGIAFAVAAGLVVGGWQQPPQTALERLPWAIAGFLALEVLVRVAPARWVSGYAVLLAYLALMLAWLGWGRIGQGDTTAVVLLVGLAAVAWSAERFLSLRGRAPTAAVAAPAVAALGLGGVAFVSGSLVLMQLSVALAAALAGFALWHWPRPQSAIDRRVGGMGVGMLALVAALVLLLTPARPLALLPLAAVFMLPWLLGRVRGVSGARWSLIEPLAVVVVGLLLGALSVWLAGADATPADDPYYR